ncbi:MAG: AAA family ATPase, partial [Anaerolineae bacterium]
MPDFLDQTTTQAPMEARLNLALLHAELARLDILLSHEIRRWQLAGQDLADAFRGLHISEAEAAGLLARSPGESWGETVSLPPDEQESLATALDRVEEQIQTLVELAHRHEKTPGLEHLAVAFGLDRFDLDTLLVCLAPALDRRYERLYAYLQDDVTRKQPRVDLLLNLLCDPGLDRLLALSHFAVDAPLFKYHLLERAGDDLPGTSSPLNHVLAVDASLVAWLLGRYQPHSDLGAHATLRRPDSGGIDAPLPAAAQAELEQIAGLDAPPIVLFWGSDTGAQQAAARFVARRSERPLLTVDLAGATEDGLPPLRALRLALRDALLTGALPFLTGWDACLDGTEDAQPALLAELFACPGLVVVSGRSGWQARGLDRDRRLVRIEFPLPGYAQRLDLWSHFLGPDAGDEPGIGALAGQFALTTHQIRDAVASARDRAGQEAAPLADRHLFAAARAHSNPYLSSLARKIVPRYDWADIVLPDDQLALLREIVASVRGRPLVLEAWGVGRKLASSAGITILFAGPPGTGKTMAAEVMAAELGLDLYKIDLSTVVSKYI